MLTLTVAGKQILYSEDTNGGGATFGQDFIATIRARHPNRVFKNCFEWCAGPGIIGFMLLAEGLVERLTLLDCNPVAIDQAAQTAKLNGWTDRVTTIVTDNLNDLHDQFDLVVANPPFFDTYWDSKKKVLPPPIREAFDLWDLRVEDHGWKAHQNFFANIARCLSPDGLILTVESGLETSPETFREFITAGGLKLVDSFPPQALDPVDPLIYYMDIRPI